jgi:hypothetical protein
VDLRVELDRERSARVVAAQVLKTRERGCDRPSPPAIGSLTKVPLRAEELAKALVDAPIDDRDLGTIERQQAVVRALDATFPLQQTTVEVELPASGEQVGEMSWQDMQALAARLLAEGQPEISPIIET